MKKRCPSLESYRLLMMFCICWLHCAQQGGRFEELKWVYYLNRFSVVGFVFMSGYFGVSFRWRKVLRLAAVAFWGAMLSVALRCWTDGGMGLAVVPDAVCSVVRGYWFLWAYIAMMMVAPILNAAAEGAARDVVVRVLPFLVLVFGWSYAVQIPCMKAFVPKVDGFSPLSALTLGAVYVCARLVRAHKCDEWMTWRKSLVVVGLTVPVCCLGLSHYNSPFAFLLAFAVFCLFRKIPVWEPLGRLVNLVAPSMFSVYILHQCRRGFGFVTFGMSSADAASGSPVLQSLLAAMVVFALCVAIDMVCRRLIWNVAERCFGRGEPSASGRLSSRSRVPGSAPANRP